MQKSLRQENNVRLIITESFLVLVILSLLLTFMIPRFIGNQNINRAANFPDPAFRAAVERCMGVEPGGRFTQLNARFAPGPLICSPFSILQGKENEGYLDVQDLEGIQFFKNLQQLELNNLPYNKFDFSIFPELTHLVVMNCVLEELDLSRNPKLEYLVCKRCYLSHLDLSQNPQLIHLDFSNNKIETIDLSHNLLLESLDCSLNHLADLDLSKLVYLQNLNCRSNFLSTLDISHNLQLRKLSYTKIGSELIDTSKNPLLGFITYDEHLPAENMDALNGIKNQLQEFLESDDPDLSAFDFQAETSNLGLIGNKEWFLSEGHNKGETTHLTEIHR